jgi:hypothetical protein
MHTTDYNLKITLEQIDKIRPNNLMTQVSVVKLQCQRRVGHNREELYGGLLQCYRIIF